MSWPQFFQTGMGRVFFDRDVPAIVKGLQDLNKNLAALVAVGEKLLEAGAGRADKGAAGGRSNATQEST